MNQNNEVKTIRDLMQYLPKNGLYVIGITGPAGAGKTNMITPLIQMIIQSMGEWCTILGLDSFFKLSSEARAEWLKEGKESGEREYALRRDQMNWWDFPRVESSLRSLKAGKSLHLGNVYNRADKGRLTGVVHIVPPSERGILLLDGVAIAHLQEIDMLLYIHAEDNERLRRLMARDIHRGYDAAKERFELTQEFEGPYFRDYWERIHYCVDNSVSRTQFDDDIPIITKPEQAFF